MNIVNFIGNVGTGFELRYTQSGTPIASGLVISNSVYIDKEGARQEKSEAIRVVFFGKAAENVVLYTKKGSTVVVNGRLKTTSWEKDGVKFYRTEIIGNTPSFHLPKKEDGDKALHFNISQNQAILIGNLGDNPSSFTTDNGTKIVTFRIATAEMNDETEWHTIVTFGKLAESCEKYLVKGSKVGVLGRIQTRDWQKEGEETKRYSTEIVAARVEFLNTPKKDGEEDESLPSPSDEPLPPPIENFIDQDIEVPF